MIGVIGEILADMIGTSAEGIVSYARHAGGAPFNLACAARKLGADVLFHGVVGEDAIGSYLLECVKKQDLDPTYLMVSKDLNTTLALVSHDQKGERSFCFYRKNTADDAFGEDIPEAFKKSEILHFGTLMLSSPRGREFALREINAAKKRGQLVSMDVNYREDVFPAPEVALKTFKDFLPYADILKFSEEEVALFGEDYVTSFFDKMVLVTLGKEGSKLLYKGKEYLAPSIAVEVKDTTGAGDAFFGAFLAKISSVKMDECDEKELVSFLRFSNVVAALNTTSFGAIDGLPTLDEVKKRMEELE